MSLDRQFRDKVYRLETLKKYQAYYGPNTPYQIVAEINQLEGELRRMLKADVTRPTKMVGHPASPPAKAAAAGIKKKSAPKASLPPQPAVQLSPSPRRKTKARAGSKAAFKISSGTTDALAVMALVGVFLLLAGLLLTAIFQYMPGPGNSALAQASDGGGNPVLLRPTFTPTVDPSSPQLNPVAIEPEYAGDSFLPPAQKEPTAVPTHVPTITPSPEPEVTATPQPLPSDTPAPTKPAPPPPAQTQPQPPPPAATPTPEASPTPAPPAYPFSLAEQGNRMFQGTNYHVITIYVGIVSEGNIPMGGYKVVGDHSSGRHIESALSDWNWSVTNCLNCDYVKFGNVKLEPGIFEDGVWNLYVADEAGNPVSDPVGLSYSADPSQWVWDFLLFKRNS